MDFLDPKQRRAHDIRLVVGYILIGIALILATVILKYQADGFGVKEGKVIQNGLVFASSSPAPATIWLNNEKFKDTTNTRMVLQSGTFTMRLTRDGYRDWQRALTVEGGSVEHFDYPLLVPKTLSPVKVADYATPPPLMAQSPDRRWIIAQQPLPQIAPAFDMYDLKDPKKVISLTTTITLPASVLGLPQADAVQSFEVVEWSNDNDHVVLRHINGDQSEYILLSRDEPETSINLTRQLQLPATAKLTLQDKKYDRYFVLDSANNVLSTASLGALAPKLVTILEGVLAYKTYGDNVILYATTTGATSDKTAIRLYQDKTSHTIRQVAKGPTYLLELSRYSDHWFVAVGAASENHVYVYRDPFEQLQKDPTQNLVPVDVVKLTAPNYVAFSDNSQFIMVESGQDFAVYDAENERSHVYRIGKPLDAPATHATWMDGFRMRMVSGGQMTIFDYDGTNVQSLGATQPAYLPLFDSSYQTLYMLAPPKATSIFQATSLRTAQDQ